MNFICALMDWLRRIGAHCSFEFDEFFAYDRIRNVIKVGINEENGIKAYEQMLYEYGAEYYDIYAPVLVFLHELGHYATVKSFSDFEISICNMTKAFAENQVEYWEVPDEFSAIMWEIKFINNCPQYVDELSTIYHRYWNDFIERRL